MKLARIFIMLTVGAFAFSAAISFAPKAIAGPGLSLTENVKEGLIGLKPVRGVAVTNELFDGKPLLVVFFASW